MVKSPGLASGLLFFEGLASLDIARRRGTSTSQTEKVRSACEGSAIVFMTVGFYRPRSLGREEAGLAERDIKRNWCPANHGRVNCFRAHILRNEANK